MVKSLVAAAVIVSIFSVIYLTLSLSIFKIQKDGNAKIFKYGSPILLYIALSIIVSFLAYRILYLSPTYMVKITSILKIVIACNVLILVTPYVVTFIKNYENNVDFDVFKVNRFIIVGAIIVSLVLNFAVIFQYRSSTYLPSEKDVPVEEEQEEEKVDSLSYTIVKKLEEDKRNKIDEEKVEDENKPNKDVFYEYKLTEFYILTDKKEEKDLRRICDDILEKKKLKNKPVNFYFYDDKRDVDKFYGTIAFANYLEGGSENFMGRGMDYILDMRFKGGIEEITDYEKSIYYEVEDEIEKTTPVVSSDDLKNETLEESVSDGGTYSIRVMNACQTVAEKRGTDQVSVEKIYRKVERSKQF
ncbi:hypothetical protein ACF3OI_09700 (plasmid) [Finegoldia magna]|uniref:hypothetical protein n=1 Tax=Finegoldia magna TaxID=1260 RepID=UPI00370D7B36